MEGPRAPTQKEGRVETDKNTFYGTEKRYVTLRRDIPKQKDQENKLNSSERGEGGGGDALKRGHVRAFKNRPSIGKGTKGGVENHVKPGIELGGT